MNDAHKPARPLLQTIRALLDELISNHAINQGVGPDAYCEQPTAHPMADAKFLTTICQCYDSGIVGKSRAISLIRPAVMRLGNQAVPLPQAKDGLIGWGLGFNWEKHGYSDKDPLLINTSIVMEALHLLFLRGLLPDNFLPLYLTAKSSLMWWGQEAVVAPPGGVALPVYGLNKYREPVLNSAAYCLSVNAIMEPSHHEIIMPKIEYIISQYKEGAGWNYSYNNQVIDLLHQWYIIVSIAKSINIKGIEPNIRNVIGQFGNFHRFLDVAVWIEKKKDIESIYDLGLVLIRDVGSGVLALKPKPARLWSLGEMLVGLSRLCEANPQNPLWSRYAQLVINEIWNSHAMLESEEWHFPRHAMHIAHGLAAFIAMRRKTVVI
jgi:hypothetical protein